MLTLGKAAKEVGKSKTALSNAIKAGRLSATKKETGAYEIDPAELFRVYPPKRSSETVKLTTLDPVKKTVDGLSERVLSAQLTGQASVLEEKEKQIRTLESEVDHLRESLKLSQEGHNNATRLLEDKRGDKNEHWQRAIAKLENQISEKEIITNEKLETIGTENSELAKQKKDLKKANKVYAGLAFIIVVGVGIFALMQSGIIQIN